MARSQWRVVVGTDAPLPELGDRLLLEILDDQGNACSGCRRQFGAGDPTGWPQSFGVEPPASGGRRVRARLYRTAVTGFDGEPGSDRILDALVRLPELDGVTTVRISLEMACFGVLASPGADTTCDPTTGTVGPTPTLAALADPGGVPSPGTWAPAQTVDCTVAHGAEMVCIPGGAFLLGSPVYVPLGDLDPVPEQLVQVAPFALDTDEMTVGEMRALVAKGSVSPPLMKGSGVQARCTYTAAPTPESEALPVNCVSLSIARAACAALHKRLPTEAEWEYAARNLERETPYPWGLGDPCANAIVARGDPLQVDTSYVCQKGPNDPVGPRAGGAPTDVTALGVHNLAGNLAEWIDDDFRPYGDPACWGPSASLHVNPVCKAAGLPVLRGGDWASLPFAAKSSVRGASSDGQPSSKVGLRCAR